MSQSKKKETQKHVLFSLSYPSNVISITCKNPCHKAKNSVKPVERKASRSTKKKKKVRFFQRVLRGGNHFYCIFFLISVRTSWSQELVVLKDIYGKIADELGYLQNECLLDKKDVLTSLDEKTV